MEVREGPSSFAAAQRNKQQIRKFRLVFVVGLVAERLFALVKVA